MAQNEQLIVKLKIQDLETFTHLVNALGVWCNEVVKKDTLELTDAEVDLLHAAAELSDKESPADGE